VKSTNGTRIASPSHSRLSLVLRRQRRLSAWTVLVMLTALGAAVFAAACLL
jgi:hypothetical protein